MNEIKATERPKDAPIGPAFEANGIRTASSNGYIEVVPRIPDYDLLRRIGGGAYGEVWLARSQATGVFRATKIVWRRTFADDRPFQREFDGLRRFESISREHPGQLALFHIGRNDPEGYFYYIMELADAVQIPTALSPVQASTEHESVEPALTGASYVPHTLRAELAHGRVPAARVLEIGLALAEALDHLHQHGLVHRDVKPSNVIFVNGRPKLADIGLVTDASDTCSIVGTEGYLPPEGPGTPQADLFALGKVLYEAATGLDRREFPRLPEDVRSWPDAKLVFELNEIVLKACASTASERYRGAEALGADLKLLGAGKSIRQAHKRRVYWRVAQRCAAALSLGAAVVALFAWGNPSRTPVALQGYRPSTNEVANRLYRTGKHRLTKMTAADSRAAADLFEQAINEDPQFGAAYSGLAMAYLWALDGWNDQWKVLRTDEARKALELDSSLSEPYIVLAWYKIMREWNWREAGSLFQRALKTNPSDASGYHFYAEYMRMMGRTNEALANMQKAIELEPGSIHLNTRLQDHYIAARRFEDAVYQGKVIEAMETNTLVVCFQSRALCAMGYYREATEWDLKAELLWEPPELAHARIRELRKALDDEGPKGYWRVGLSWMDTNNPPYWRARSYAQLGETNKAIEALQASLRSRDTWLTFYVMTDWTLDPIRSEPRFHDLLQGMNLEEPERSGGSKVAIK